MVVCSVKAGGRYCCGYLWVVGVPTVGICGEKSNSDGIWVRKKTAMGVAVSVVREGRWWAFVVV